MTSANTGEKLKIVLYKLLNPNCRIVDDTYLEKLLSHIPSVINNTANDNAGVNLSMVLEWLYYVQESWRKTPPNPSLVAFVVRMLAVISNDEERFKILQKANIINNFIQETGLRSSKNVALNLAYTVLLSSVAKHNHGRQWIIATGVYKDVINFCHKGASIYIAREGQKFVTDLLNNIMSEEIGVIDDILKAALGTMLSGRYSTSDFSGKQDRMLTGVGIACHILETALDTNNTTTAYKMIDRFNLESVGWSLLNSIEDNTLVGEVSRFLALIYFVVFLHKTKPSNKITSTDVKEIEANILNLLSSLFARAYVRNALKVIVQCHFQCNKISKQKADGTDEDCKLHQFENQLITLQMAPVLSILSNHICKDDYFDYFCTKLGGLAHQETIRTMYGVRKMLKDQPNRHEIAHLSVLSILQVKDVISRAQAVIVFQILMYTLKEFLPESYKCVANETITPVDFPIDFPELLSTILEALKMLINYFQINWSESVETICVLTFLLILLDNRNLSCKEVMRSLQLLREVLESFLPPHLALLIKSFEDSSMSHLGPVLRHRLHDTNWEVRDSALDVLQAVVRISEIKYQPFQEHLLEHQLPALAVALSFDDSESYVRASAIGTLCLMVQVERYWAECLSSQDLAMRMMNVLQKDPEGIVRREAAALITVLYDHQKIREEMLPVVFNTMSAAALGDLHWEVQVNALSFWQKVIDRAMTNQGMIDGVFPSVTFSREHRKIVTLTEKEIQIRLRKALSELSHYGCLQVLLVSLQDCNLRVVCKAASAMSCISALLSKHNIIPTAPKTLPDIVTSSSVKTLCDTSTPVGSRYSSNSEAASTPSADVSFQAEACERVIDDIMCESDVKLLGNVYRNGVNNSTPVGRQFPSVCGIVDPDDFVQALSTLHIDGIVKERSRWLDYYSDDLGSLLDDILASNGDKESNLIDCY